MTPPALSSKIGTTLTHGVKENADANELVHQSLTTDSLFSEDLKWPNPCPRGHFWPLIEIPHLTRNNVSSAIVS